VEVNYGSLAVALCAGQDVVHPTHLEYYSFKLHHRQGAGDGGFGPMLSCIYPAVSNSIDTGGEARQVNSENTGRVRGPSVQVRCSGQLLQIIPSADKALSQFRTTKSEWSGTRHASFGAHLHTHITEIAENAPICYNGRLRPSVGV
jgi:hypothetical protein